MTLRIVLLFALMLPGAVAAAVPVTFQSGNLIRAAEVNQNFAALDTALAAGLLRLQARLDRLEDSLAAQIGRQKTQVAKASADSLALRVKMRQDSLAWAQKAAADSLSVRAKARLDSTAFAVSLGQNLPKGTIAGSLVVPGADGYLPNSGATWLLAAGQGLVNGVTVPDLRGQFLRGIDFAVTAAPIKGLDPDGSRKPGAAQTDAFQGFQFGDGLGNHLARVQMFSGTGVVSQNYFGPSGGASGAHGLVEDLAFVSAGYGTPRVALETRPKNVAVYWYVKVK